MIIERDVGDGCFFGSISTFIACLLLLLPIGSCLQTEAKKEVHAEACRRNYGHYVLDKSGNPVFEWKEPNPEKP